MRGDGAAAHAAAEKVDHQKNPLCCYAASIYREINSINRYISSAGRAARDCASARRCRGSRRALRRWSARGSPARRAAVRRCARGRRPRSEEHTSELQSLMRISYAVFCLKKKKSKNYTQQHTRKGLTVSHTNT